MRWLGEVASCPNLLSVALKRGRSLSLHSTLLAFPLLGLLVLCLKAPQLPFKPRVRLPKLLCRPSVGLTAFLSALALVLLLPCLRNPSTFNALRSWIHVCLEVFSPITHESLGVHSVYTMRVIRSS